MANETVLFKRGDSATINSTPVTDGQILFDTSGNGKMYLDNGTDRLEMGGAITVDASLSKTSTNAIQNKAVTGNILNSLAEVSAATQQNTIAGALALKEVNSSLKWKSIYNGAIGSVNVNVENKEELRLRLLLSDKQYSPYMTISTEQTDGIWVLFCHVGNNIASVQFSIENNVLAYVSHNFVGSWTINTFTLEVLAK